MAQYCHYFECDFIIKKLVRVCRFPLLHNWVIFFSGIPWLHLPSLYPCLSPSQLKFLHCVYVDRPFDGQEGFQTHSIHRTVRQYWCNDKPLLTIIDKYDIPISQMNLIVLHIVGGVNQQNSIVTKCLCR